MARKPATKASPSNQAKKARATEAARQLARSPRGKTKSLTRETAVPPLAPRPADGHKAVFGHVLVLAGSYRYTGAPVLTARAALRSGCGLVTLACPKSAHDSIAGHLLCEMSIPVADAAPGVFSRDAVSEVLDFSDRMNAIALGPGLTTDGPAMEFAQDVAVLCPLPMVIDADGVNALAGAAQRLEWAEGPRVLTPHPGEAARLLGCSPADILKDREAAAMQIARQAHAVVLLKGSRTLVTDVERLYVNTTGNSGMATAGSGDVLTGVIASLLAQGMPAFEAAVLGAYLHGRAGDLAAQRLGEHGMIATDILDHLPAAFLEHANRG
jgi:NAD(P)H-hydrate epimerase